MTRKEEMIQHLFYTWDAMLNELYYNDEGWESDHNYWLLLVECILSEYALNYPNSPEITDNVTISREAVISLDRLGLLTSDTMKELSSYGIGQWPQMETGVVIFQILNRHGFSQEAILQAFPVIWKISSFINNKLKGHIRRLLRGWGNHLINEMQRQLLKKELDIDISSRVAANFVNSLTGLPTNFEPEGVESFRRKFEVTSDFIDDMAYKLNISIDRLHTDLAMLMENYCANCDPSKDLVCVRELKEVGIEVKCPLNPDSTATGVRDDYYEYADEDEFV